MVFDLYQTTTRVKGDQDESAARHSLAAALCAQLQRHGAPARASPTRRQANCEALGGTQNQC